MISSIRLKRFLILNVFYKVREMTKHTFLYLESTGIGTQGLYMNPSAHLKPLHTVMAYDRWQKRTADSQFL